jgi:hypothetical protein
VSEAGSSLDAAQRQLDRVHSLFSRVESKSSFLLATNLGLLAIAFYNLDYKDFSTWYVMLPFIAALTLVALSLYELYAAAYPQLEGGSESLIYFSSIADLTEVNYLEKCSNRSEAALLNDLHGQVWRNAQILSAKFKSVRLAFSLTVFSIFPWAAFLLISSFVHARSIIVK